MIRRRGWLAGAASVVLLKPARAEPEAMAGVLRQFTGGATVRDGRVNFDVAALVENGNTVPITVTVDSAMGAANAVRRIAIFTERNPQPDVAVFEFGPLAGKAQVATRMRLATSQMLVAVAQFNDGSFWQHRVEVIVTLAACLE